MIAGFGGQGILLMGNLLAMAGMRSGLRSTYLPVYGPEMRGGTANCTVILADEEIPAPLVARPAVIVTMNGPSLDKFGPRVRQGGLLLVNSTLADPTSAVTDQGVRVVAVPAGDLAGQAGDARLANMAALGALVRLTGFVPLQTVLDTLPEVVPSHYSHLIPINIAACNAGAEHVRH